MFRALRPVVVALAVLGSAALPAAASAGCPTADGTLAAQESASAERAVVCLVNRERVRRGLRPLRQAAPLRSAARRHSADMVRRRYFQHIAPGGGGGLQRARRAGYGARATSVRIGENIAWGSGRLGTPAAIVAAWMRSPGHRANILGRPWRQIGVGAAQGTPLGLGDGATYTADFGAAAGRARR